MRRDRVLDPTPTPPPPSSRLPRALSRKISDHDNSGDGCGRLRRYRSPLGPAEGRPRGGEIGAASGGREGGGRGQDETRVPHPATLRRRPPLLWGELCARIHRQGPSGLASPHPDPPNFVLVYYARPF